MRNAFGICMNIITNNLNLHTEKEKDYNESNDENMSPHFRFR
jgi:hypothetical protein